MKGVVALLVLSGCAGSGSGPPDLLPTPQCANGLQDSDESDVDCGGSSCPACLEYQKCNSAADCAAPFDCTFGRCSGAPAPDMAHELATTGAPCTKATDCGGTKPQCVLNGSDGTVWPEGYCSSYCNPLKNDPLTGLNTACPGDGTCAGQGTFGLCLTPCTDRLGVFPCQRNGYACFYSTNDNDACLPSSISHCDPTACGVGCPPNQACLRQGPDDVGDCFDACDPLAQGCTDLQGQPRGCYATQDCPGGGCSVPYSGGMDGSACHYNNSCDPGFACLIANNAGVCRPYCGGPNSVPCPNNRLCVELFPKIPIATVGVCAP